MLARKPEVIAFNKADALDKKTLDKMVKAFKAKTKKTPLVISAAAKSNLPELLRALMKVIAKARKGRAEPDPQGIATGDWTP